MTARLLRGLQRLRDRARRSEGGYTLVEVVASVVILGIIMVPLGTAMVFGYRTVFGISERMASTTDLRVLSTYFPSDVASVDTDGVFPSSLDDQGICMAAPSEESLIVFRWDKDLGENGQTVVRYLARGEGRRSQLVRRACHGSDPPVETVLAQHFGEAGTTQAAMFIRSEEHPDVQTPVCGVRECFIDIHGAYDFHLSALRRVEGQSVSGSAPGAPTNVHALGGYQRARLFWNPPASDGGQAVTGYYVQKKPPAQAEFVGGDATPTLFPADAGNPPGALIEALTNDQSYEFRVRAVNGNGNGPWSEWSAPVTPGPTTPEPPTLDTAAGDPETAGRITAEWSLPDVYSDGGAALTSFRVTAVNPDSVPTTADVAGGGARSGAVTDLEDNTRYTVQVSALNTYGEGSPSNSVTGALTLPGAPGTPTAAAGPTSGSVVLTFTPPSAGLFTDFTAFRARVGSTNGPAVDAATACESSASCSITVEDMDFSSGNSITVQAQNATGWGALSGALTIPPDTAAPTVTVAFPSASQYGPAAWNAGCSDAGGAICGSASDAFPGSVANVRMTVRRSNDSRYWNGSPGTSNSQWSTSTQTLTATGTNDWTRALTTASLQNTVSYTVTVTATDEEGQTSTPVVRTFTYVTGMPTASLTAPANGATVNGSVTVSGNAGASSPATVASAEFQYRPTGGSWTSIDTDTSSPYSVSWDTTALDDGGYDLRLIVTDSAGNSTTSSTRSVTVDNVPPTGNVTEPVDGVFVRGSVTVKSNSADSGSGVANARFEYKPAAGSTWTTIGSPDTSSPYQVSWNTGPLVDGAYQLRVTTTDGAAASFTSPVVNVLVDNTDPVVGPANVVGTPGTNGWYTSDVGVSWPAPSDALSGIVSSSGCGPTLITTNTSGQALTCSATDGAGNTASSTVTIKRDVTPPSGSLAGPADGAAIAGTVTVSSNSADPVSGVANATFQRSPAGANTWTTIGAPDTSSPYQVSWNTASVAAGNYDLRVVTTDQAGNTFTSPIRTVTVDNTAPTASITFPAADGAYNADGYNAGCVTNQICGTATDTAPGSVADVGVTIRRSSDNRYWNGSAGTSTTQWSSTSPITLTVNGVASWNRAFTTASLQTGVTYTVVATATDQAGLTGTDTHAFVYDTTNPTGTLTAPADGENVSGSVTVSSNSADSGSGVASAVYQYRAGTTGSWTTIGTDTSSPYSVSWNTTPVTDGQYYLRVTTTDNAGNGFSSGDTAVRVRVDTTNPTGTLTAPANNENVSGSVTVSSNSADSGSGVASAVYQYRAGTTGSWTTIGTDTSSPYSVSWNTTPVTDGQYYLRVTTTDNAGNGFSSGDTAVRVRVDNTNPTGSLTAPNNGEFVSGTVTVSSNSADSGSGVADAVFQRRPAGGGTWTTIGTDTSSPYSVSWNTGSQSEGSYDLRVITTDNAGNSFTSATRTVTIDRTAPTASITFPANNGAYNTDGYNAGCSTNQVCGTASDAGAGSVADVSVTIRRSSDNRYWNGSAGTSTTQWSSTSPITLTVNGVASWNRAFTTASLQNGVTYTLVATATDQVGLTGTDTHAFVYDTTAPTGSLTAPDNSASVSGTVTVSSSSADSGSGVADAVFQRRTAGGGTWTTIGTDTSSPYSVSWNTTSGTPNGSYDLRVVTTDNAGNSFTSATRTVTVDNTKPTVTSLSLHGSGGGSGNGTAQSGDQVRIVFSEPIDVSTLCSTWSGTGNQSSSVTVTLTNSSSSDYVTLPSPCTNIATGSSDNIDTNANYLSSTRTFSSSTVAYTASSRTLTITLGTPSGSVNSSVGNAAPTFNATGNITDVAGNTLTADFTGTSSRF